MGDRTKQDSLESNRLAAKEILHKAVESLQNLQDCSKHDGVPAFIVERQQQALWLAKEALKLI